MSPSSGCPPLTVSVTDCSIGSQTSPVYSYTNDIVGDRTTDTFYTFTEPGSYIIVQQISTTGGNNLTTTQSVNVWPIPIPEVEITHCDNFEVHIDIASIGYDYYVVDWDDGGPLDTFNTTSVTSTHPYSNSTARNVRIYGRMDPENCGNDTTITITPIQSFEPTNIDELHVLGDTAIALMITGQQHVGYELSTDVNGGAPTTKEVIAQSASFNDSTFGIDPTTNTFCFELIATDKCASSAVPASQSDKACSVILNGVSRPGFNEIKWDNYTGDNTPTYELNRNLNLLNTLTTNPNPYNDSSIFCSQEYNYQLVTSTHLTKSYSNRVSVVGQSEANPQPVTNVHSSFDDENNLTIRWYSPSKIPPLHYTINSTEVTDTFLVLNSTEKECYEISYTDSCNNISQISDENCPIILTANQNSIFELELNWNHYSTFQNGLDRYEIYVYDNQQNLISKIENGTSISYFLDVNGEENQIYYFKIEAISNDSISTFSNKVELILDNRIAIPNAFSPNGDGLNDVFIPKVRFTKEFKFAIYNKWGENVFNSSDSNDGWDGGDFPPGVYSYFVEVVDYLGETTTKNGTVTLIR